MKITFDFKDPKKEMPSPKNDFEMFLTVSDWGYVQTVTYSRTYGLFNAGGADTLEEAESTAIYPRWWAEIPPELQRVEGDDGQEE
jgi:hypothetical protein